MKDYLDSVRKQMAYYKLLGDRSMAQVADAHLFWQCSPEGNSIATLVKHLAGNMRSRFTDFLTSDGEKPWRDRESEFDNDLNSREEVIALWETGWKVFLETLDALQPEQLEQIVYIRNQGHTVMEALNRQLAHYPYHIGQMVFIAKMCAESWESLSIPRGGSAAFNADKFAQDKQRGHFTDEFLQKEKK